MAGRKSSPKSAHSYMSRAMIRLSFTRKAIATSGAQIRIFLIFSAMPTVEFKSGPPIDIFKYNRVEIFKILKMMRHYRFQYFGRYLLVIMHRDIPESAHFLHSFFKIFGNDVMIENYRK
jgi:hypothetical protein